MWYIMFEMLLQFCIENNHCNVPPDFEVKLNDGRILRMGLWLQAQRHRRKCGLLPDDKLSILQSLVDSGKLSWDYLDSSPSAVSPHNYMAPGSDDFNTPTYFFPSQSLSSDTNAEEVTWNAYFEALNRFSAEFGHCNVPKDMEYPLADGRLVKLGSWLEIQHINHTFGELSPARLQSLQYLVNAGTLDWIVSVPPSASSSSAAASFESGDGDESGQGKLSNESDGDIIEEDDDHDDDEEDDDVDDNVGGLKEHKDGGDNGIKLENGAIDRKNKRKRPALGGDEKWMLAFDALIKYGDLNGTCNVPYKVL
jgi:hypothetical protein